MDIKESRNVARSLLIATPIVVLIGTIGNAVLPKRAERSSTVSNLESAVAGGIPKGGERGYSLMPDGTIKVDGFDKTDGSEKVQDERYPTFRYQGEIKNILKHAERLEVEPEMLMALRSAEDGGRGVEYGIFPKGADKKRYEKDQGYFWKDQFFKYESEREKQLSWAAWTIKKNWERFAENPEGHENFISYFASKYAPIGAKNDPKGLNRHWERNFRIFYNEFKGNE